MSTFTSIAIVFGIVILFFVIKIKRSNAAISKAFENNNTLAYDDTCHLLTLQRRSSTVQSALTVEASHNVNLTSVPDKLVYTGATVGGVSTGGFHVQKGGNYASLGGKTGAYYISYKFAEESHDDYGIHQYIPALVSFVELTDYDFDLAKDNSILKKYIVSPETKKKFSSFYRSDQFNKCTHLLFLNKLPKSDAEYIIKWMSGNN